MKSGEHPMANEPRTIHVPNDSELAHALEDVDHTPVLLEKDGVVFRVSRDDRSAFDVDASKAAIREAAGSWRRAGIDAEAFKSYIRERRHTANRPPV